MIQDTTSFSRHQKTCVPEGRSCILDTNAAIGTKVKNLRIEKKMTLKQLSEGSGLSVGFLSQFERGLSSIALDSLEKLSRILEVPLSELFKDPIHSETTDPIVHGVELAFTEISPQIYQSILRSSEVPRQMLPRVFTLLPLDSIEENNIELYCHEGEEFVYVLEGVVTFFLENARYLLYPGDSIHISSTQRHNWANHTSRNAKILTINTPNPLNTQEG